MLESLFSTEASVSFHGYPCRFLPMAKACWIGCALMAFGHHQCVGQVFTLPDSSATVSPGAYYGVSDDLFDLSRGTSIVTATPHLFDVRHILSAQGGPSNDPNNGVFADGAPLGASGSILFELPSNALVFSITMGLNQDGTNPRRGAARYVFEGLDSPDGDGVVLSQAGFATNYLTAYDDDRITVRDTFSEPFWGRFFRLTVFQQTADYGARINELDGFGEAAANAVAIHVPEGRARQGNAGPAELLGNRIFRKTGIGTLELDRANDFEGWLLISEGAVLLADPEAISRGRVAVSEAATLEVGPRSSVAVGQLHMSGFSRVDVSTGSLTVMDGLTPETAIAGLLKGRGDSTWNGTSGILSTQAATDLQSGVIRSVGWKENADGSFTFGYAAPGDTDLSGDVNVFDLVNVNGSGSYGKGTPSVWSQGDFDYNGVTNIFDMVLVNGAGVYGRGNYLPAPTSPVSVNAVPEPSTCLPVLVGLASGLSAVSRNRHYGRLRRSRIIA